MAWLVRALPIIPDILSFDTPVIHTVEGENRVPQIAL